MILAYRPDHQSVRGARSRGRMLAVGSTSMRWNDRVYGDVAIDDPRPARPDRLPDVPAAPGDPPGRPSAFAFPFKTVTRYEHSLGVYLLLGRSGPAGASRWPGCSTTSRTRRSRTPSTSSSPPRSRTTTSGSSPSSSTGPTSSPPSRRWASRPSEFFDDSVYPAPGTAPALALRRPARLLLPRQPGLRRADARRPSTGSSATWPWSTTRSPSPTPRSPARPSSVFAVMNRDWWASPTEAYIYNEFADALREGFRLGVLHESRPARRRRPRPRQARGLGQPADRREARPHPPLPPRAASPATSPASSPRPAGSTRR